MKLLSTISVAVLVLAANSASAQTMGMTAPSFGCQADEMNAITIACAGLEVSEDGCPEAYTADKKYCVANDAREEHILLIRNVCPEGFEMLGKKCIRPDVMQP